MLEDRGRTNARLGEGEELLDHLDGLRVVRREGQRALASVQRLRVPPEGVKEQPCDLDVTRSAVGTFSLIAVERDDVHGALRISLRAQRAAPAPRRGAAGTRDELQHAAGKA